MASNVFFIKGSREDSDDLLAEKALKVFERLDLCKDINKEDFVGLKIHFGEKGNKGYIKPPWIKDLVERLKGLSPRVFITDTNTLYVGNRSNACEHLRLAKEHGFSLESLGIPVIIADGLIGRNDDEIKVELPRIKTAKIAETISSTDWLICLSHFTGHILTGFGSTIKNLGMGCASRAGKLDQHSDVQPYVDAKLCKDCKICYDYCPASAIVEKDNKAHILKDKCIGCGECLVVCNRGAVKMRWDGDVARVQEKMAEYAYSVIKTVNKGVVGLTFLTQITKDCDCMSTSEKVIIEDIGILASSDPVALDFAAVELIQIRDKDILRKANDVDWSIQLRHGENIGLGSRDYKLIEID